MTREKAIQVLQTALTSPLIYGEYADAISMAIKALQNLSKPNNGLQGSDLISRVDVYHILEKKMIDRPLDSDRWVIRDIDKAIRSLPSADTDMSDYCDRLWKIAYERGKADRPTGEWVYNPNAYDYGLPAWECDQCGCINANIPPRIMTKDSKPNYAPVNPNAFSGSNYCPNCGAKMRGEDSE